MSEVPKWPEDEFKKPKKSDHHKDKNNLAKQDKEANERIDIMYKHAILEKFSNLKLSDNNIINVTKLSDWKRVWEIKLDNWKSILVVGTAISENGPKVLELGGGKENKIKSTEDKGDNIIYIVDYDWKDTEFSLDKKTWKVTNKEEEKKKVDETKKVQEVKLEKDKTFTDISEEAYRNNLSVVRDDNKWVYEFRNNSYNNNRTLNNDYLTQIPINNFPIGKDWIRFQIQEISRNRGYLCVKNVIQDMNRNMNPKLSIGNIWNWRHCVLLWGNRLPKTEFEANGTFHSNLNTYYTWIINWFLNNQQHRSNEQHKIWPIENLLQNQAIVQALNNNKIRISYSNDGEKIVFVNNDKFTNYHDLYPLKISDIQKTNIVNLINDIWRNKFRYSINFPK